MPSSEVRPVVLLPAYNEAAHLAQILEQIREVVPEFELVVVDDGSTDSTARVAAAAGARVLRHPFNLGYGGALQTGYKDAVQRGVRLLVQLDSDGQHDPSGIPKLLEPVEKGDCDLVIGSRFIETTDYHMGCLRRFGRNFFRFVGRLSGLDVRDPTSGFQAMNHRVLRAYVGDFYPMDYPDVDVLLVLHRMGLRITERSTEMSEGFRPTELHGGLRPIYYMYKMLLSAWSASTVRIEREETDERDSQ